MNNYDSTHSSLKNLAEKGCWDVAEAKTKSNKQFLEYLVGSPWIRFTYFEDFYGIYMLYYTRKMF